jgi:hypothetical protein
MSVAPDRLQTVVLARLHTSPKPLSPAQLASALARFAPVDAIGAAWRTATDRALAELVDAGALDPRNTVLDRDALGRRLVPASAASTWKQLCDRVLPALGLGIGPADLKTHSRLSSRDAWAAAIVSRALGLWTHGAPPTMPALCDQFAWQRLGLVGKAKRLPAEVRALCLQRELATTPAPVDRLLRLLAARELATPRTELRSLRDALVRRWLEVQPLGAAAPRVAAPGADPAVAREFVSDLRLAVANVRHGSFGDRKVFISAAWSELRTASGWADISLQDFKAQLLHAHRAGQVALARADLVGAMDAQQVALSETLAEGASFHFVVREGA